VLGKDYSNNRSRNVRGLISVPSDGFFERKREEKENNKETKPCEK